MCFECIVRYEQNWCACMCGGAFNFAWEQLFDSSVVALSYTHQAGIAEYLTEIDWVEKKHIHSFSHTTVVVHAVQIVHYTWEKNEYDDFWSYASYIYAWWIVYARVFVSYIHSNTAAGSSSNKYKIAHIHARFRTYGLLKWEKRAHTQMQEPEHTRTHTVATVFQSQHTLTHTHSLPDIISLYTHIYISHLVVCSSLTLSFSIIVVRFTLARAKRDIVSKRKSV